MVRLSTSASITIFLAILFVIGTVAASYYYYGTPHSTNLRILYTHSEGVVDEVVSAFEEWYQQAYGQPIKVTASHTNPQTAYEKTTTIYRKAEAEIWWGGPLSLFEEAYSRLLPYNSTHKDEIDPAYPLMDLSSNTPRWYAASLYGLGVMYNEHRLNELRLDRPRTWTDLNSGEYAENITMVDPTESEFTSPFIMLRLESENWTKAWEYLVEFSALIKEYDTTEHDSALKVSNDYLPLAVIPDFYAYDKIAIGIPEINFTYLDTTILQPDPVAIISKGVYIDEAKAFIDYILTLQAQNIIGKYLLPIHRDATAFPSKHSPFDPEFPNVYVQNATLQELISDYYQAWITERHSQLKKAWREIREANVSSPYYELAWNNFTYAGHYLNKSELDTVYIETENWTDAENITVYMTEWREASAEAYNNAIENAQKSRNTTQTNTAKTTLRHPEESQRP